MRILLYLFAINCFFACSKHSKSSISSPPDKFYFKGTVNGTQINWASDNLPGFKTTPMNEQLGIVSDHCSNTYCKNLDLISNIRTESMRNGKYYNEIKIGFTYASKTEDFTLIRSWLNPGNRTFGAYRSNWNQTIPIHDGVVIDYTDENGRPWSSTVRISDQNGSNFESIELKDAAPDKSYQKIWTAKFSCKMYSTVSCPPNIAYETMLINDAEICIPVFNKQ